MSQLYDITLAIHYRYQNPARSARTLLRMQPLNRPDQRLVSGLLTIDPEPATRRDWTDFFGNAICEVAHDAPTDRLTFRYAGRVERRPVPDGLDLSCPLADLGHEMAEVGDLGPGAPHHFIGASERVQPVGEITAFARAVTSPAMSALTAVKAISRQMHAEFDFDSTATDVRTDPAEAFRNRRGVCQDISHVTIAALRAVGIPAGYVSGFLRTVPPEGKPRLEGADAMHAWVRAWCGAEVGWVQIDPTNDMRVGTDHVMVALGRDYADVAPVRGTLTSAGEHDTQHHVDVVPV
ncbi:transglutaminase family protein [Ponticoccus alexandrii]|uniref:Transglutaminase family protein n=1 Tax=Ponticoccus alexandrii TaxID=1943633 RepID=A0ABX7FB95_9RHOB|nr:transglutaminase family protein [Ponticoccus alexandrii]ETA50851.1 transglutaminase [Rhodobacteraceae bacterium PD-2]QRF67391.1 transglutaminase family protein [Ponticoccus alexandrii]